MIYITLNPFHYHEKKLASFGTLLSVKNKTLMIPLQFSLSQFEGPYMLLFLLVIVIWCIALVAVANGRFNDNTTKLCWFFIILFLNILGVLLFVIWGRKEVYGNSKVKAMET
jgi:phosphoglycerol transferase MdoB-like AlkP superfamily enzyme